MPARALQQSLPANTLLGRCRLAQYQGRRARHRMLSGQFLRSRSLPCPRPGHGPGIDGSLTDPVPAGAHRCHIPGRVRRHSQRPLRPRAVPVGRLNRGGHGPSCQWVRASDRGGPSSSLPTRVRLARSAGPADPLADGPTRSPVQRGDSELKPVPSRPVRGLDSLARPGPALPRSRGLRCPCRATRTVRPPGRAGGGRPAPPPQAAATRRVTPFTVGASTSTAANVVFVARSHRAGWTGRAGEIRWTLSADESEWGRSPARPPGMEPGSRSGARAMRGAEQATSGGRTVDCKPACPSSLQRLKPAGGRPTAISESPGPVAAPRRGRKLPVKRGPNSWLRALARRGPCGSEPARALAGSCRARVRGSTTGRAAG